MYVCWKHANAGGNCSYHIGSPLLRACFPPQFSNLLHSCSPVCNQKNVSINKAMISLFEILSNQDAPIAPKYSTWFSLSLTWEFFLQVREVDICIENRCYSCHFTQSFFLLPLQGASLSIGHGITFTLQGWSSRCPRAVGIIHHWIECWILIPDKPEKGLVLQIV